MERWKIGAALAVVMALIGALLAGSAIFKHGGFYVNEATMVGCAMFVSGLLLLKSCLKQGKESGG